MISELLAPRSSDEDSKRREFILNILLFCSIFLFVTANIVSLVASIGHSESYQQDSISTVALLLTLAFFVGLYYLSRKGFFNFASYLLLGVMFLLATYMIARWGVEVQAALLFFVLIIVMAGILISTRLAFIAVVVALLDLATVFFLQNFNLIHPNRYWTTEQAKFSDVIMFGIIFAVIATVSWLSNREIEKSLRRARASEAELKNERDSLETTVEERTRELKESQLEKMTQLYRFAEFGRLSTGIFHDLLNPLNAVALNMEKVISQHGNVELFNESKTYLERAFAATKKMEDFVLSVRRQMSRQENSTQFSLTKEIQQVIDVLSHKAIQWQVKMFFTPGVNIETFGNAVKFNQVVLNLVANAIESYGFPKDGETDQGLRKVEIEILNEKELVNLTVKDYGVGIPKEDYVKVFQPFYTTKMALGMGIGLSTVKRIVEKDFNGIIKIDSEQNRGTLFTVKFPKKYV